MTRVTIKDIATALGLTVNTVSHALRDKPDISETTKQKVRNLASEMGYVPNVTAASLRSGRTRIVGIVYDNLLNPYYSIMTHYLDESLSRNGYSFITFAEKHGDRIGKSMVERLLRRNVDGIISFLEPDEEAARFFANATVPLLIIGRHLGHDYIDYIYTDDRQGGTVAAEHLVAQGYRRITFLADTLDISCAAERVEGYKTVMRRHALPEIVRVPQSRTYESMVDDLLAHEAPDAFICFNDLMAFEVLYALERRGRRDVAVVGYDNIQNELKIPGQLTTVGYDKAQIADIAVEVLMFKIDRGKAGTRAFEKVHGVTLVKGVTTPQKAIGTHTVLPEEINQGKGEKV